MGLAFLGLVLVLFGTSLFVIFEDTICVIGFFLAGLGLSLLVIPIIYWLMTWCVMCGGI